MTTHVKVVGVMYIALSALGLLFSVLLFLGVGGIAGLVGATADPDEAAVAIPIIGIVGTALAGAMFIVSVPGLLAGIGLLAFKSWARILGIVIGAICLLGFPWFTLIGVYGLWVLLSKDSERLFDGSSAITAAR